jgi:FlaA1/EpsC-like NDP-sugar epimerase
MKKNNIPLVIIDIIIINVALFMAFYLKFEGNIQIGYYQKHLFDIAILSFIKIAVYFKFNFYRNLWKYASIDELFQIISAAFISNAAAFIYLVLKQSGFMYNIYTAAIILILDMFFLGMSRFSYRINKRIIRSGKKTRKETNVMVVGAGDAGASVIRELKNSKQLNYRLLAIIDDDKKKHGQRINGIPVLGGREDITNIAKKKDD